MEFDNRKFNYNKKLFEAISDEYTYAGYKLPKLVFWNVSGRTNTIPMIENDAGVSLVSGFSTSIAKMIMSDKTTPYAVLLETLQSDRYLPIAEAIANVV